MNIPVVLVGYPGSTFLVPASSYLTNKYLPGFHIQYISHSGPKNDWSKFVCQHLEELDDELVIFSLDDYLLRSPINQSVYEQAVALFSDKLMTCVKIHRSTPEEHQEYPVTTQYTIWRREELIWLLKQTTNPWNFETSGSRIFEKSGKRCYFGLIALEYYTSSALSVRWKGVRLYGLTEEDATEVQKLIDAHGSR